MNIIIEFKSQSSNDSKLCASSIQSQNDIWSFLINEDKKKYMKREKNGMEMLLIVRLMCGPLCQVNQKSIALDANQLKLANNG